MEPRTKSVNARIATVTLVLAALLPPGSLAAGMTTAPPPTGPEVPRDDCVFVDPWVFPPYYEINEDECVELVRSWFGH